MGVHSPIWPLCQEGTGGQSLRRARHDESAGGVNRRRLEQERLLNPRRGFEVPPIWALPTPDSER